MRREIEDLSNARELLIGFSLSSFLVSGSATLQFYFRSAIYSKEITTSSIFLINGMFGRVRRGREEF